MRVALSTSVIQRGRSGVAQYVFAIVRALLPHVAAGRLDLDLLVLEDDLPLFSFAEPVARLVPVSERYRPAVRNIAWHQCVLPGWLRRQRVDVLHIPSYRRMLVHSPCALVTTIHDLAPFHVQAKYDPLRMFYGRVVVPWLASRQHALISVSETTAVDIRRFFPRRPALTAVVHNGLDHTRFTPGDGACARRRWQLPHPFFLYVSRLEHPAKNHVRLIQAFEQFKSATGSPWQLVFGGSDWHGADVIHSAVSRSPFARDIRCLGFVPDSELAPLYRAAGAMVYPSLFEGFGFPPLEAMACGCPVISSRAGSLDEVVGDAAHIVNPEDVADLVKALSCVSSSVAYRDALILKGISRAVRFNWQKNADSLILLYNQSRLARSGSGFSVPVQCI